MTPTFTIDEDGITIILHLDSQYEKAVGTMLKEYEVLVVNVLNVEKAYYVAAPEVRAIRFRMTRRRDETGPKGEK